MMNGYEFFAGGRLVTVFSAANYYPDNVCGILKCCCFCEKNVLQKCCDPSQPNHGASIFFSRDGRVGIHKYVFLQEGVF